ncbi:MAG: dephospho-CoA kinase [Clostridia bacterium]|nr:dephospho-CoA kinase [Clostridia bacterium]
MIVIGLCGTSGSGKGYICDKFSQHGVAFIDTDKVYREDVLTDSLCVGELTDYFGQGILVNGQVSKKMLATAVFESQGASEKLKKLNSITHKYIKIKTDELVCKYEGEGFKAVLIDAPVLFESGFDKMCQVTVCVTAPYELKLKRIMARDGITKEKAVARINTQIQDDELRKRCTYEIDNTDGVDLISQIKFILKDLGIE